MKTKIPAYWYQELVDLCFVQSYSNNEKMMVLYLDKKLSQLGLEYTIDKVGNIIVTKGKSTTYPCVVSHMDTVHSIVDNYKIHIDKRRLFATKGKVLTGIGGDDKCGVLSCLYFLKTLPVVKVVFFTQEESGCKGSNKVDKTFFNNCRYIIQLDRRGNKDFIDTKFNQKTVSQNFLSEVGRLRKEYKFKSTEGSITDVVNLWMDGVGISCINLSAGYYNAHMASEYINIDELWHSILFTKEIIQTLKSKIYKSVKKQIKIKINNYSNLNKIWCSSCGSMKLKSIGSFINNKFKCWDCIKKTKGNNICDNCYKLTAANDLRYSNKLMAIACSKCRVTENDKTICDICNNPTYIRHGHEKIDGHNFVCYTCYIDIQSKKNLKEYETCSVCSKKTSKVLGKYSGELFVCKTCNDNYDKDIKDGSIIIATERCDACLNHISISQGVYGDGGGTFKCYNCLKINRKIIE